MRIPSPQPTTDTREKRTARALLHKFIESLPDSYHFNGKERGGVLSTGQRQLLSFLRSYVYNPDILILDEATSSIDSYTEKKIQSALDVLLQNRTSITIAHRLATVRKCDRIIVLNAGKIEEVGNHKQLLKNEGLYSKLYSLNYSSFDD